MKSSLETQIEEFLEDSEGSAYTLAEIPEEFDPEKDRDESTNVSESISDYINVGEALKTLMRESKIRSKVVLGPKGEDTYYTIVEKKVITARERTYPK